MVMEQQQQAKPSLSDNSTPTPSVNDEEENNNNNKKDHGDEKAKQSMDQFEQNDKDPSTVTQAGEIESTKTNLGEMMEENQRLKQYLDQIMKDYQALQMRFYEIAKEDSKKPKDDKVLETPLQVRMDEDDEVEELVSLSLGRTLSVESKKSVDKLSININSSNREKDEVISGSKSNCNFEEMKEKTLALGLNCNFEVSTTSIDQGQTVMPTLSPDNGFDETKNGEANDKETLTPNTMPKNNNTGSGGDDEVAQQPPVKKARVSVRARCDTPTMNDGCQWRKYGQKIAKGNPCPRGYYRCTVAPSCPVRKQVQRCAEDMSILITTYEGTHNHPLPISATAMASTTSAAAYMLMSGSSSTSSQSQGSHSNYTTTTSTITSVGTKLHGGLSFNVPNISNPKQLYLPNSSSIFSTTIPTNPTITLDLTTTNSSLASQFNRTSSFVPRTYPSSNLSFNSSNHSSSNTTNLLNTWSNGLLNYGHQPYTKQVTSSIDYIGPSRHLIHQDNNPFNSNNNFTLQTVLSKDNNLINNSVNQQPLQDTITQAAKVLTSDPSFQSAITAALSSFISSNNNNNVNEGVVEHSGHNGGLSNNKWGTTGSQSSSSSNSTLQSTIMGTNGCGSSLLSMTSSTMNSQSSRSVRFLSPSLSFSKSNSASTSLGDNRDHTN